MGSESVVACGQPWLSSPRSPISGKAQSLHNTSERVKGACYYCNQEGHWFRDCPRRSTPTRTHSPTGERPIHPELLCPCGLGACVVLTSRTPKNPGRDFYRCPAKQSERCSFFKWCDEAASDHIPKPKSPLKSQLQDVARPLAKPNDHLLFGSSKKVGKSSNDADPQYPICSCGAGKCMLVTVTDGENAGRKYFACHIKKGHGACNHFQWLDDIPKRGDDDKGSYPTSPVLDDDEAVIAASFFDTRKAAAPVPPPPRAPPQPDYDLVACVSPRKPDNGSPQISPLKRLSLGDDGPGVDGSKNVRRLRFGAEGDWSECAGSLGT